MAKILPPAYGAITDGLDLALYISGALMGLSALLALVTMRVPRGSKVEI